VTRVVGSSAEADAVDALLREVRVSSTIFCQSTLSAPWGFGVRARGFATFHVVTSGACWLEVDGEGRQRRVNAGDLVILPRGDLHWLRDDPGTSALWLEDLVARYPADPDFRLRGGGGGATTSLLCGALAIAGGGRHPALAVLPPVVHLRGADERPRPWLAATLELISIEVDSAGAGAAAIWERLSEIMLGQALRAALVEVRGSAGIELDLLHDRGVSAAVRALHEHPERAWTLGELSQLAAMSRSAFASRFRALTGESPIRYARRCRLVRAAEQLRASRTTLAEVARRAGYESEFSFSRAFKRLYGVAPGIYRDRDDAKAAIGEVRSG
jgi:AraC-like DNA-binding protein